MALSLARVPPGGDFDVSDVAVKVGRALVERRHELVQRVERELRGAAQRQADDVPLLPVEGGAAGEDDVPENCAVSSAVLACWAATGHLRQEQPSLAMLSTGTTVHSMSTRSTCFSASVRLFW